MDNINIGYINAEYNTAKEAINVTAQKGLADFTNSPLQPSKTVEKTTKSDVSPVKYEQLPINYGVEQTSNSCDKAFRKG